MPCGCKDKEEIKLPCSLDRFWTGGFPFFSIFFLLLFVLCASVAHRQSHTLPGAPHEHPRAVLTQLDACVLVLTGRCIPSRGNTTNGGTRVGELAREMGLKSITTNGLQVLGSTVHDHDNQKNCDARESTLDDTHPSLAHPPFFLSFPRFFICSFRPSLLLSSLSSTPPLCKHLFPSSAVYPFLSNIPQLHNSFFFSASVIRSHDFSFCRHK